MDDFDGGEDLEGLFRQLRTNIERRKSLETSYEDACDSDEGLEGSWGEWMCPHCGTFMKERHRSCLRCHTARY